jgi:hypothetical protein
VQTTHYEVTYRATVDTPMGNVSEERIKAVLDSALNKEMSKQRGAAWPGSVEVKPIKEDGRG